MAPTWVFSREGCITCVICPLFKKSGDALYLVHLEQTGVSSIMLDNERLATGKEGRCVMATGNGRTVLYTSRRTNNPTASKAGLQ